MLEYEIINCFAGESLSMGKCSDGLRKSQFDIRKHKDYGQFK